MDKKINKLDISINGLKDLLKDKDLCKELMLFSLENCCVESVVCFLENKLTIKIR